MTAVLDKNRKELGVGDEVVVHFHVVAVFPQADERTGLVNLVSMNNRRGKPPVERGTAEELVAAGEPDFEDLPVISIMSTPASRVILQRKAKPDNNIAKAVPA